MGSKHWAFAFCLLGLVIAKPAAAAAPGASFRGINDLVGFAGHAIPYDVSDDGSVIVGVGNGAFRWSSNEGMTGLGTLGGVPSYTEVLRVSGDGSVVVGLSYSVESGSFREAYRWTSESGMMGLGDFPGGRFDSGAFGISGDGSTIVGRGSNSASGLNYEAFRWTSESGMVGLGYLPGGSFSSSASAASRDGSVIVGASSSANGNEAFYWTSAGGMVGLGDLPNGGFSSFAVDVSGDGLTVVGTATAQRQEAFRWTSDTGMVGLGVPPGGHFISSFAESVSDDGSIVVGFSFFASPGVGNGREAFRWTSGGGMERLWDALVAEGANPAADGWTVLYGANAVSADGSTIVGFGQHNGQEEGFVAFFPRVPEPSSLALISLTVTALLRRESRRRRALQRTNPVHTGGRMRFEACEDRWMPRFIPGVNHCAIAAVLLSVLASSAAFAAASLTPLGDLPGGPFESHAYGVSGDGSVVVGSSSYSVFGYTEAFRWTSDAGMVGLGDLPGATLSSVARGVSADGSVIVGTGNSASGYEAFRWTSEGGMVGLGYPLGGFSRATRVSGDGSVVVGIFFFDSFYLYPNEAFRWTSGGGMAGLGWLHGGYSSSYAEDVSSDGSVVVGASESASASGYEAFRWTSDGGMVGLGVLPGNVSSYARGVSGDGSVVVGANESASGYEAFRWTSDGGMVGLGVLPGNVSSDALGVSGDGSIVVGRSGDAFRWTSGHGMERLWDVLVAHGVDPAADGWTNLANASGISADGRTIVGAGTRNGNTEAFAAFIPIAPDRPGDFNFDGMVDAADLAQWQGDFGLNSDSDADNDGDSDGADFLVWQQHFSAFQGYPPSNPVPEPSTDMLLTLAVSASIIRRYRGFAENPGKR